MDAPPAAASTPAPARKRKRPSKKAASAPGEAGAVAGGGGSEGGGAAAGGAATPPSGKKPPRQRAKASKASAKASADDDLELVAKEEGKVDDEVEERLGKTHGGVFSRDLPWLMYGFGDADKPLKETLDLVEAIAVQFITDTVHAAMHAAAARNPGASSSSSAKKDELRLEDLLYAVRRDPRKVARIQELIRRQQEIKDARKVVEMEGMPDND